MFDNVIGLGPELRARWIEAVSRGRELLADGATMDELQWLLRDLGLSVIDAIAVTSELIGNGADSLGEAKSIVDGSPARARESAVHEAMVTELDEVLASAKASGDIELPDTSGSTSPGQRLGPSS